VGAARDSGAVALVVKKRHADDEYGIVLLSDVAREVLAKDRSPERVNIYEIMSKPVIGVNPEMDIRYCTRLFDKFGLSYAPVIDKGELKGIVSYANMVLRGLCFNIQE
jgi:predicted transcriptional regulator